MPNCGLSYENTFLIFIISNLISIFFIGKYIDVYFFFDIKSNLIKHHLMNHIGLVLLTRDHVTSLYECNENFIFFNNGSYDNFNYVDLFSSIYYDNKYIRTFSYPNRLLVHNKRDYEYNIQDICILKLHELILV